MSIDDERPADARGGFVPASQLLSAEDVTRALTRMAHEIVEHNRDLATVTLVGLQTGGEPFARRLAEILAGIGAAPTLGLLDVSFYRDDLRAKPAPRTSRTHLEDLTDQAVVLVDDVLYTGRTIRAALNALSDFGRPRSVQLAVMVDRGHRELPIRPDYVGKNLPTSRDEDVRATLEGVWIGAKP